MKRNQLLLDGLWRCLCPAFDRARLSKAALGQTRRRRPTATTATATATATATCSGNAIRGCRAIASEAAATSYAPTKKQWQPIPPPPKGADGQPAAGADGPAVKGPWDGRLLCLSRPNEATLLASSLPEITRALMTLRDPKRWESRAQDIDQHQRTLLLVRHLISARGQLPSHFIYECLADAMADPQGSVSGLRRLLDDMAQQGMKPTAAFCRSALDVLVNHPDYVMRQEILDIMQQHWFAIDAPVKQRVVLGLLRDEQYELAYSRLADMIEKGAQIESRVYEIFILTFGKLGYLDEMLSLLHRRCGLGSGGGNNDSGDGNNNNNNGSGGGRRQWGKGMRKSPRERDADAVKDADTVTSLLYYALDVCSRASHYPGTMFAWNAVVRTSRVVPSDGLLEGVLATAAHRGDAQLATEAFETLSGRGRMQVHHYDAVLDAFCEGGDVAAAIRTLCIMRDNGIRVTRSRTRTLHRVMTQRGELALAAEAAAREVARERALPQELVGAILDAVAAREGSAGAMRIFDDVPLLCGGAPPSAGMMEDMVVHGTDPETRRVLLREYAARFPEGDTPALVNKENNNHSKANNSNSSKAINYNSKAINGYNNNNNNNNDGDTGADDARRSATTYVKLSRACAEAGEMDLAFRFARLVMASADARGRQGREFFEWVRVLVERAAEREDGRIWPVVDELRRTSAEGVGKLLQRLLQQQRMAKLAADWKAKQGRGG